ncbi:MAG: fumarylacetoacetate hydrolase family protein [Dehalococcoidia bacterium]
MKIVRYTSNGRTGYGVYQDERVAGLRGTPFRRPAFSGKTYNPTDVKLRSPCTPSKIICLGLNYRSHAEETKLPIPEVPLIFLKPSTAVIGPEANIILPRGTRRTDYEGELGVVIGKRAKDVDEKKAYEYVLGYTCFNDVSERYNQRDDGQWTRAKGYDTFAPIGPWVETEVSPEDLKMETFLNGQRCQSSRTSDLIFSVPALISFISHVMTLLPGDVIATGTPAGIGRLNAGDTVEIAIEGIGTLRNGVENARQDF